MVALRKADRSEWESLEAFGRIKPDENVDKQDKQNKQKNSKTSSKTSSRTSSN